MRWWVTLVCGASVLAAPLAAAGSGAEPVVLIDFEMEDQFRTVYSDEDYAEGVFVVVGADRAGSAFTGGWSSAVRQALAAAYGGGGVRMAGLAHTKGVPRLLRGFIRRKFPREPDDWVLLDWKGVFDEAYGFEPESANVLVFLDGVLVAQTHGREVEQEKVDAIVAAFKKVAAGADEP